MGKIKPTDKMVMMLSLFDSTKDKVPYKRDDNMTTKVKWSIQTSDVDKTAL